MNDAPNWAIYTALAVSAVAAVAAVLAAAIAVGGARRAWLRDQRLRAYSAYLEATLVLIEDPNPSTDQLVSARLSFIPALSEIELLGPPSVSDAARAVRLSASVMHFPPSASVPDPEPSRENLSWHDQLLKDTEAFRQAAQHALQGRRWKA